MFMDLLKRKYLVLFLILVFAFLVRSYEINEPWIGHHDWNGVLASNIARNTIRYGGFVETEFALINNYYFVSPDEFSFYNHHPQLPYYLLTLWYYLLGVSEWSTRLLFILFSVVAVFSIYLMTRKIWNEKIAIYAAFIVALMPFSAYYGRLVNPEPMILFFIPMAIYFYFVWLDTQKIKYYFAMLTFLVLAQLSDWPGYFLSMVPVLHNLVFGGKKRNVRLMGVVVLTGVLNFFLFLAYVSNFPDSGGDLVSILAKRTMPLFLVADFWFRQFVRIVAQFTFVVVGLAGYAGYIFWKRGAKIDSRAGFVLLYVLMALVNPLFQSQAAYTHDYVFTYNLIPMFAILGAIGFVNVASKKLRVVLVLFFIGVSLLTTLFYFNVGTDYDRYYLGKMINENTNVSEAVMLSSGYRGPHVVFYADRNVVWGIRSVGNFSDCLDSSVNYRYWIYDKGGDVDPRLLEMVRQGYMFLDYRNYLFFDLNSSVSVVDDSGFVYDDNSVSDVVDRQYGLSDKKRGLKEKYKYLYDLFKFW